MGYRGRCLWSLFVVLAVIVGFQQSFVLYVPPTAPHILQHHQPQEKRQVKSNYTVILQKLEKMDAIVNFTQIIQELAQKVVRLGDRCVEKEISKATRRNKKKTCLCPDPLVPKIRYANKSWLSHFEMLRQEAASAPPVDVVMLGDSLIEMWRGTKRLGLAPRNDYKQVFETYFGGAGAESNSTLTGLALGASLEITSELLWKLHNGLVPSNLDAKIVFLLIGTNDLGVRGCSSTSTLMGVLNILDYLSNTLLRSAVPDTTTTTTKPRNILIHGILPRIGSFQKDGLKKYRKLGGFWNQIGKINRRLAEVAEQDDRLYYMDSSDIFLTNVTFSSFITVDSHKKQTVAWMPDGVHPNVHGYKLWGARIVDKITEILQNQHRRRRQQQQQQQQGKQH